MSRQTFSLPRAQPDIIQPKPRSALTPSFNKEKTDLLQLDRGEDSKD